MRAAVVLIAMLTIVGCVRPEILRVSGPPLPAREAAEVEVFLEQPSRAHRVIAEVSIKRAIGWDLDDMQRQLVAAAAREGGNAIVIHGVSRESGGAVLIPAGSVMVAAPIEETRLSASVIVWN